MNSVTSKQSLQQSDFKIYGDEVIAANQVYDKQGHYIKNDKNQEKVNTAEERRLIR